MRGGEHLCLAKPVAHPKSHSPQRLEKERSRCVTAAPKPGAELGDGLPVYNLYPTREGWIAVTALEAHFLENLLLEFDLE